MPPETDTSTQTTAEAGGESAAPAHHSAPTTPSERPQLASFADALTKAQETTSERASKEPAPTTAPKASDAAANPASDGVTAEASKPSSANPVSDPQPTEPGTSAPEASTAEPETQGSDGKPDEGKPSRRERAEIRDLTADRDRLAARVTELEAATTIPDHVLQSAVSVRLTDDEFNALETKLKREDITGEYLTQDERAKYTQALQVREWSQAWYADAQQKAADWANARQQAVMQDAASQLAPVIKARSYISPEVIGRSDTWTAIYEHLCDAAEDAGRKSERAELQPKLDEATTRITDLEAELLAYRTGGNGRARTLETGGAAGGAFSSVPDYRTASSSDLFSAALVRQDAAKQRNGRRAVAAR